MWTLGSIKALFFFGSKRTLRSNILPQKKKELIFKLKKFSSILCHLRYYCRCYRKWPYVYIYIYTQSMGFGCPCCTQRCWKTALKKPFKQHSYINKCRRHVTEKATLFFPLDRILQTITKLWPSLFARWDFLRLGITE